MNDRSLHLKNKTEWSSVFIRDYYVIKIQDIEIYLNNFATKTTFNSKYNINNNKLACNKCSSLRDKD